MQRVALVAVLALAAVCPRLGLAVCAEGEEATTAMDELDDDNEGDSAPFMVVVRHADGRSCGAALVTLHTALSSAACARPRRPGDDVWAVASASAAAPATPSARRVLRIAYAASGDIDEEAQGGVAGDPWAGAAADLALLELAAPLAGARPILMATDAADCTPPAACHLMRRDTTNTSENSGDRLRLRVADVRLADSGTCAARGPRWPALRARTLCLAGPSLCKSDWGTGVVCSGKLCGVVSRSAGAAAGRARCGEVHAAASVPRWRRFLHCAHTRHACGRVGDCADLCNETLLGDTSLESPLRTPLPALRPPTPPGTGAHPTAGALRRKPLRTDQWPRTRSREVTAPLRTETSLVHERASSSPAPPALALGAAPAASRAALATPAAGPVSQRPMLEFEPNRADFRMTPARTSRVLLKAGEYGDNAAEYAAGADELSPPPASPAPARSAPAPAPAPAPTRTTRRAAPAYTAQGVAMRLRPVHLAAAAVSSPQRHPLLLLLSIYFCYRVI